MKTIPMLVIALLLAGCDTSPAVPTPLPTETAPTPHIMGNPNTPPALTNTALPPTPQPPTEVPPTEAPATQTTPPSSSKGVEGIIDAFKSAGLPIGETVIYTEETDPNKLLGRPNQYIAKASWHDTRLEEPTNPQEMGVSDGGGIEIFPDAERAKARFDYIQEFGKSSPTLVEYGYLNGPVLLRLSKELTPTQAKEYQEVFGSLVIKR